MTYSFAYGHGQQTVNLQSPLVVSQISSKTAFNPVELSINAPIACLPIHQLVTPADKVVVLVSDITRPCPTSQILPYVLEELSKANVPKSQIQIIVSTGLHRTNSPDEMRKITGEDVFENYTVLNTNPELTEYVGKTRFNTPVEVFKPVLEADFRIAIGAIEMHYFAGFTGGYKAILAGVCSANTIQANHSLMHHPNAKAGILENNPVRMDMDELDDIVPLNFIVNVILDSTAHITAAVSGHPIIAHRHGCLMVKFLRQHELNEAADIVMVSAGGYPKDINLYQAQKALDHAVHAVRKNGIIILIAECPEGFGNANFESWLLNKTPQQIKDDIVTQFVVGGHKAAALVKSVDHAQVWLVSSLPRKKVIQCKMTPFYSADEALAQAVKILGHNARVLSIPEGTSIFPIYNQNTTMP